MSSLHTYFNQVDTLMGHQGYHLKRFYPATTRVATVPIPGGALRPGVSAESRVRRRVARVGAALSPQRRLQRSQALPQRGGELFVRRP